MKKKEGEQWRFGCGRRRAMEIYGEEREMSFLFFIFD